MQRATRGLDHVRLTVAVLLVSVLTILWMSGSGPLSGTGCCVLRDTSTAEVAGTTTMMPASGEETSAPESDVTAPSAEVMQNKSELPRWAGPTWPTYEHEVHYPPAQPEKAGALEPSVTSDDAASESSASATAATADAGAQGDDAAASAEPAYTIESPNAEVMQNRSELPRWTGPTWPTYEHDVHYPPAPPDEVESGVAIDQGTPESPATTASANAGVQSEDALDVAPAEPAFTIDAPNAEVQQAASTLQPWQGPSWPTPEHFVYYPPDAVEMAHDTVGATADAREAVPVEEPSEEETARAAEDPTPAEPAYTITAPNAEALQHPSNLEPWSGPTRPVYEHFVYHPPSSAPSPAAAAKTTAVLPSVRVYFRTARTRVTAEGAAALAPIAKYLEQHSEARAVIRGFHDPHGYAADNLNLAKGRAINVRAALRRAGVAADRITIETPPDSTGTGNDAEARRAEIEIHE